MPKVKVTTRAGSIYLIDREAKTWERLTASEKSGPLRTNSGTFNDIEEIEVGKCMLLWCPPLPDSAPGTVVRFVQTSPVVEFCTEEAA